MNDDYSDAFKSIVPEAPSADGWADGARRKRRNRGRLVAGVVAAAAIALIVPLSLTLGSDSTLIATPNESPSPAATDPMPDPATDAPGAAACWDGPDQPRKATADGATDGAVRAWLCGDAMSESSYGTVGPLEPLVEGVGELVDFISAQPTLDGSDAVMCTEEYTLTYRIVLDYDDGRSRVISGELQGCQTIDDGPAVRTGGQELYDLTRDLWGEQRDHVGAPRDFVSVKKCLPPPPAVAATPPQLRPMLPLVPADAVTGFACVEMGEDEDRVRYSPTLEPELVALIADSVAPDSVLSMSESHLSTWMTLTGPWGETLTLQRTRGDTFQWFDGDKPMLWTPPADLLADLEQSLEAPGSSNSTDPAEDQCDLDAEGRMATTDLPDNTLPDGPTAVWFCDESGAPREPLVGKSAVQEVVDSFTDLPTTATFDSHPTPGHAYVVVAYADGERYTVEVETRSSDKVAWGSDRQHVRFGGTEWLLALKQLWVAQRNDTPQSPPIAPEVDVCDALSWNLGRTIDRYDEEGALCAAAITDSGSRGVEVPADPSLIERVQSEARKAKTPWSPDEDETLMQDWMGDYIMLVDDYGDRLPLIPGSDGTWYWREGENTWAWTPSRELAAELNPAFDTGRPSPQPTPS